jgi:superfamily II DNA/RNA helicase
MPYPVQNRMLSGHVDILVATPGRLIDHLERGRIDFSRLEVLILDEADRMLDMGFVDDVERIAQATPKTRQTLLFSATLTAWSATWLRVCSKLRKRFPFQRLRINTKTSNSA